MPPVASREFVAHQLKALAPDLSPRTVDVLLAMYCDFETTRNTRISIAQGALLNRLAHQRGVTKSLEVGFAHGFSAVWLLDAVSKRPGGLHKSIDPFEMGPSWKGTGLKHVEQLGLPPSTFEWLNDYGIHALSDEIRAGAKYDLIYIDGNHRFDDTIVDFYLSDYLLRPGGLMILDDVLMPSVRTACDFVETNRAYTPLAVDAPNVTVYEKTADDNRHWQHFQPFKIHHKHPLPRRLAGRIARSLGWRGRQAPAQPSADPKPAQHRSSD